MKKLLTIISMLFMALIGFSSPIDTLINKLSKLDIENQVESICNLKYEFIVANNRDVIPILHKYEQLEYTKKKHPLLAKVFYQLSLAYYFNGKYDENFKYGLKAINLYDSLGNKKALGEMYGELGYQMKRRDLPKAFGLMRKGKSILESIGIEDYLTNTYNNLGVLHEMNGNADSAIYYYRKSLALKVKQDSPYGTPFTLNNIASVYFGIGNYDSSLWYLNKSTEIRYEINDSSGLAENFSIYGQIYTNLKNHNQAIENYNKALKIAQKQNYIFLVKTVYQQLSSIYEEQKNYEKAFLFHKLFKQFEDSLINIETNKTIANLQIQFETEKKQQEIEKQQLTIENQQIENHRRLIQRNFLIASSLFLILIIFIVLIAYKQKTKTNLIISEKNVLLQYANEEIGAQRDEIEAQRDLLLDQKNRIEKQKMNIDDSIRYAQRIQAAVIPSTLKLNLHLNDYFIILRPKDVLSGDFYWSTTVNQWTIVTVVDCTGHGIPGAFMSMLGMSFLNEIVRKKEITNPAQALGALRELIIESLHQSNDWNSQKDGMDMTLAVIDTKTGKCIWAGARIPLWIVRKNSVREIVEIEHDIVEVIKPDSMSVSINHYMTEFTNHEIQLYKGDRIYLFSDGIADQIGGPNGKKFMSKQLKKVIAQSALLSIRDQKQHIENVLNKWIEPESGNIYEQTDDITIMGIEY